MGKEAETDIDHLLKEKEACLKEINIEPHVQESWFSTNYLTYMGHSRCHPDTMTRENIPGQKEKGTPEYEKAYVKLHRYLSGAFLSHLITDLPNSQTIPYFSVFCYPTRISSRKKDDRRYIKRDDLREFGIVRYPDSLYKEINIYVDVKDNVYLKILGICGISNNDSEIELLGDFKENGGVVDFIYIDADINLILDIGDLYSTDYESINIEKC